VFCPVYLSHVIPEPVVGLDVVNKRSVVPVVGFGLRMVPMVGFMIIGQWHPPLGPEANVKAHFELGLFGHWVILHRSGVFDSCSHDSYTALEVPVVGFCVVTTFESQLQ